MIAKSRSMLRRSLTKEALRKTIKRKLSPGPNLLLEVMAIKEKVEQVEKKGKEQARAIARKVVAAVEETEPVPLHPPTMLPPKGLM